MFEKEFTGLFDCREFPIHEGDILSTNESITYVVIFKEGAFKCLCNEVEGAEFYLFNLIKLTNVKVVDSKYMVEGKMK